MVCENPGPAGVHRIVLGQLEAGRGDGRPGDVYRHAGRLCAAQIQAPRERGAERAAPVAAYRPSLIIGISAVEELARQIIRLHSWSAADRGIQINVGKIAGGIGANVIADYAEAEIDVRVDTMDDFRRFPGRLNGLVPILPGTRLRIDGDMNRPPMERTAASARLYAIARLAAREELEEASTGGVSDGNFIAACGTPTLDGLGIGGGGAHSPSEFIWVPELARRTALLSGILERI